jgi:hypothetical protein
MSVAVPVSMAVSMPMSVAVPVAPVCGHRLRRGGAVSEYRCRGRPNGHTQGEQRADKGGEQAQV